MSDIETESKSKCCFLKTVIKPGAVRFSVYANVISASEKHLVLVTPGHLKIYRITTHGTFALVHSLPLFHEVASLTSIKLMLKSGAPDPLDSLFISTVDGFMFTFIYENNQFYCLDEVNLNIEGRLVDSRRHLCVASDNIIALAAFRSHLVVMKIGKRPTAKSLSSSANKAKNGILGSLSTLQLTDSKVVDISFFYWHQKSTPALCLLYQSSGNSWSEIVSLKSYLSSNTRGFNLTSVTFSPDHEAFSNVSDDEHKTRSHYNPFVNSEHFHKQCFFTDGSRLMVSSRVVVKQSSDIWVKDGQPSERLIRSSSQSRDFSSLIDLDTELCSSLLQMDDNHVLAFFDSGVILSFRIHPEEERIHITVVCGNEELKECGNESGLQRRRCSGAITANKISNSLFFMAGHYGFPSFAELPDKSDPACKDNGIVVLDYLENYAAILDIASDVGADTTRDIYTCSSGHAFGQIFKHRLTLSTTVNVSIPSISRVKSLISVGKDRVIASTSDSSTLLSFSGRTVEELDFELSDQCILGTIHGEMALSFAFVTTSGVFSGSDKLFDGLFSKCVTSGRTALASYGNLATWFLFDSTLKSFERVEHSFESDISSICAYDETAFVFLWNGDMWLLTTKGEAQLIKSVKEIPVMSSIIMEIGKRLLLLTGSNNGIVIVEEVGEMLSTMNRDGTRRLDPKKIVVGTGPVNLFRVKDGVVATTVGSCFLLKLDDTNGFVERKSFESSLFESILSLENHSFGDYIIATTDGLEFIQIDPLAKQVSSGRGINGIPRRLIKVPQKDILLVLTLFPTSQVVDGQETSGGIIVLNSTTLKELGVVPLKERFLPGCMELLSVKDEKISVLVGCDEEPDDLDETAHMPRFGNKSGFLCLIEIQIADSAEAVENYDISCCRINPAPTAISVGAVALENDKRNNAHVAQGNRLASVVIEGSVIKTVPSTIRASQYCRSIVSLSQLSDTTDTLCCGDIKNGCTIFDRKSNGELLTQHACAMAWTASCSMLNAGRVVYCDILGNAMFLEEVSERELSVVAGLNIGSSVNAIFKIDAYNVLLATSNGGVYLFGLREESYENLQELQNKIAQLFRYLDAPNSSGVEKFLEKRRLTVPIPPGNIDLEPNFIDDEVLELFPNLKPERKSKLVGGDQRDGKDISRIQLVEKQISDLTSVLWNVDVPSGH